MILNPNDVTPKLKILAYFTLESNRKTWNQRRIPEFQLMFIIRGKFQYLTNGEKYLLRAGDVICIFPEQAHTITCITEPSKRATLCGLRFDPYDGLSYTANDYEFKVPPIDIAHTGNYSEIHTLFQKCIKLFKNHDSIYTDELLNTIIKELWIRLSEYWGNAGQLLLSARTRKMLAFIDDNLHSNISRKDLAREFKISPEYLNAIFKKELNTSPVQYINRQRMHRAYHYLMTNTFSVKECAATMGFDNEFYFSRLFKKVTGYSPSRIIK